MTQAERRQLAQEAEVLSYYQDMSPDALAAAWSQIQPGCEKRTIKSLLGEPERIDYTRESSAWHYPDSGRIAFNWDGRAMDIQRPASIEAAADVRSPARTLHARALTSRHA